MSADVGGLGSRKPKWTISVCSLKSKTLHKKRSGGSGRPVRGKSGQAGWPAGLGPQASRAASEIVLLLAHSGPQNVQKCMDSKGFEAFGQFSLRVRVGPASPAGRLQQPQPAAHPGS